MVLPIRVARAFHDPLDVLPRDLMERFFNNRNSQNAAAPYGVDVREDTDHLYVEAELPGFKKEEVDITLESGTLSITAEHQEEEAKDENKGEWLLKERRHYRFSRNFKLPPTVDESVVDAKLVDGVLKITLNKKQETKPRKISVS